MSQCTDLNVFVKSRRQVAEGVVLLSLADPNGGDLPAWQPGAHIDVVLRPDLIRQYSLCGYPDDRQTWQIAVLRESASRGGSAYIHDEVVEGTPLRVRGPRNNFAFSAAERYLFIAGGIGVTPIIPMVAAAEAAGADWTLLYGGRKRSSMAFCDELLNSYGEDKVSIRPQDETGLLQLAPLLGAPRADTLVYCCGPEPLLAAVEEACRAWPSGSLRTERFAPKPAAEPVRHETFEVELVRSGIKVSVPPDKSILEAIEEQGVQALYACQEGTCGSCETPVIEGIPDHRDSVLTEEERAANDRMMICVSRAACPRLVLDL